MYDISTIIMPSSLIFPLGNSNTNDIVHLCSLISLACLYINKLFVIKGIESRYKDYIFLVHCARRSYHAPLIEKVDWKRGVGGS